MAIRPHSDETGFASASESGMQIRQYLSVLWLYKWLILAVTLAVGTGVVLWTLRQPKVYQATATIEYDPSPTSPLGREVEDVASPVGSYWLTREFFATQNRIIGSRAVAERVVRDLDLHRDATFFYLESFERSSGGLFGSADAAAPMTPSVEDAARVLQGRLRVEPVEDTRLVSIHVTDRDAVRAATLANAVAEAYVAKTLEDRMGSTVSALEWLGTQLDALRHQLDDSELALHSFKEEHNVLSVSMEDRQNLVASDIQHFNEALTKARTRRIELQARAARIRSVLDAGTPEETAAAFPDNDTLSTLREQLRQKISEREGLTPRYGPQHQRMQQLDSEIEDLRRQLRGEIDGVLRAADADLREVSRVESGLRAALDEAHHDGLELNLREIEYGRLNRARENNSKLYDLVLERTTETDLTRMLHTTHVRMLDRALTPGGPISPRFSVNAAGGIGAGLLLGLGLAFLLSRLDRRLKSVVDVEETGLTILGVLPRIAGTVDARADQQVAGKRRRRTQPHAPEEVEATLFVHSHPMSAAAECCRTIRTNLTFMGAAEPLRTLVVTSASPREGKTTVTANVAISLAQSGKRVLMVDTDLRRPRIHRAFGVPSVRGVTSIVVGEEALENVTTPTHVPNLDVLPCGPIPPNPSELLHSQRFADLVQEALRHYDHVVFDSPPLGAVTDAAVLAPQLHGVLLVIKARSTTRDALASALRQLHDVGANVVGGVLNDLDPRRRGYGAGDHYYYYRHDGYYSSDNEDPDPPPPATASSPHSS